MPVITEYPSMRERVLSLDSQRIEISKTKPTTRKAWLARAGVSESTWYVWMDESRDVTPSERVVNRLAKALRRGRK